VTGVPARGGQLNRRPRAEDVDTIRSGWWQTPELSQVTSGMPDPGSLAASVSKAEGSLWRPCHPAREAIAIRRDICGARPARRGILASSLGSVKIKGISGCIRQYAARRTAEQVDLGMLRGGADQHTQIHLYLPGNAWAADRMNPALGARGQPRRRPPRPPTARTQYRSCSKAAARAAT
jgi:hypothetical protein